jgi:cyclopropane-fatty-acyl-phospholipid synthase
VERESTADLHGECGTSEGLRECVQQILSPADIEINGKRPWDIKVKDAAFYRRVLKEGSLGLGESYMDGWWECEDLAEFFGRVVPSHAEERIRKNGRLLFYLFRSVVLNPGRRSKAFEIGKCHYDVGNELYRTMLDRRMVYSCAYWKDAQTLDEAQEAKLDLICRKLGLRSGDRVLDIGCGWGSFAKYAAEKYGAHVVGITVSRQQLMLGRELCAGLPVALRLMDYREMDEKFDHIVSVGMFEHVGYKNYRTYMEVVRRCLSEKGLFLLHTIGNSVSQHSGDPWVDKYIFPNSMLPSVKQISAAVEGLFVMEDLHNFGAYYDRTLCCWYDNFARGWEKLKGSYDERFYRMWKYYLKSFTGMFRARYLQVWQTVFSPGGVQGGYRPLR